MLPKHVENPQNTIFNGVGPSLCSSKDYVHNATCKFIKDFSFEAVHFLYFFSSMWKRNFLLPQQHVHQPHSSLQRRSELCLPMGREPLQRYNKGGKSGITIVLLATGCWRIFLSNVCLVSLEKRKASILDTLDNTNLTIIGVTCGLVVILLIISVIIQIKQPRKKYVVRR